MKRTTRAQMIAEQEAWIASHGTTLAGYIARYGSKDDADHYGNGGEAIYKADTNALRQLQAGRSRARPQRFARPSAQIGERLSSRMEG
jgi:hypothetical protein